MLINLINSDDNIKNILDKFSYVLQKLSDNESIQFFIHNSIRVILVKKKEDAESQKDLRSISILPAWLIVLEKISKEIVCKLINKKITINQYGFKEGSDCSIAKTMIYYKSKKYNYNKALLIDVCKAYDSVNRNKLKEIIINNYKDEEAKFLIYFIEIYDNLTMMIEDEPINSINGLPQGSSISPAFFNLYINDALEKINETEGISAQAYADDLIIQSNEINKLQNAFDKTIELYQELNLKINTEKCELISDNKEDKILDKNNKIDIIPIEETKYLGQIINSQGIPTTNIKNIHFGSLINSISKEGQLTRIAKIRIFQIYMKSKINHLIPLISITGGINELWKNIRKIIFRHLLEYSTLPRESASSFGLSFYEVIIRPVLKFIKRNTEYTNNKDEEEMLKYAAKELFKKWLVFEPNHTDELKEKIQKNIDNNIEDSYEIFDKLISIEKTNRLYKGHVLNLEESKKLRIIKSPGLIVLISNEPIHEVNQRLTAYIKNKKEKENEYIKSKKIIEQIFAINEYIKSYNDEEVEEDIKNENIEEALEKYIIKEIKINEKWKLIKNKIKEEAKNKVDQIINNNIINIGELERIIAELRKNLSLISREKIKEIEIGVELDNLNNINEEIKLNFRNSENKRPPGRPKKEVIVDNKQKKIDDIFKSIIEI